MRVLFIIKFMGGVIKMSNFLKHFKYNHKEDKTEFLSELVMRNISQIDSLTNRVSILEDENEALKNEVIDMKKLFNPNQVIAPND